MKINSEAEHKQSYKFYMVYSYGNEGFEHVDITKVRVYVRNFGSIDRTCSSYGGFTI
jgi:hypothetical protein